MAADQSFTDQLREYRELAKFYYKTHRFHEALNEHGEWQARRECCQQVLALCALAIATGLLLCLWFPWLLGGFLSLLSTAVLCGAGFVIRLVTFRVSPKPLFPWSIVWLGAPLTAMPLVLRGCGALCGGLAGARACGLDGPGGHQWQLVGPFVWYRGRLLCMALAQEAYSVWLYMLGGGWRTRVSSWLVTFLSCSPCASAPPEGAPHRRRPGSGFRHQSWRLTRMRPAVRRTVLLSVVVRGSMMLAQVRDPCG